MTSPDDRLRILDIVRFPIGGIRSYLGYTYSRLDPARYAATVVTVDRPEAGLLAAGMAPMTVDVRTVPEKHAIAHLAFTARALLGTRRYALVHSHGSTAAAIGSAGGLGRGIPHVVTLHETFEDRQFAGLAGRAKRYALASSLGAADAIVVVSNDARRNLLEHVPLSNAAVQRVEVIRNGVSVAAVRRAACEDPPRLRRAAGLDPDVLMLGYVGRFMPEKGFDVVIEAVRRLVDRKVQFPRFVIVAVNDGAFIREYRRQVTAWGLDSWFVFAGFQRSAAGALKELDAVIMPSRREACGLVAMEALVVGCPLIASDCIGLREVTEGTPALTAAAGNAGALAEAISLFLTARGRLRAAALAYIETAKVRFDSLLSAEQLAATFARALHGHTRPAAVFRV